jgi:hypothetical protein
MEPSKVEEMAGRLAGLEAEVRRLRRAAVLPIVMVLAVVGFAAFTRPRAGRPLTVGSVEIRDGEGRLRGTFGVDSVGLPGLKLYDHRGFEQVTLAIPTDDTSALYFAERGSPRLLIESTIHGASTLRFIDTRNRDGAMLALAPDGSTRLALADGEWEAHAGDPATPAGSADRPSRTASKAPVPVPNAMPTASTLPDESPTMPVTSQIAPAFPRRSNLHMPLSYRMLQPE